MWCKHIVKCGINRIVRITNATHKRRYQSLNHCCRQLQQCYGQAVEVNHPPCFLCDAFCVIPLDVFLPCDQTDQSRKKSCTSKTFLLGRRVISSVINGPAEKLCVKRERRTGIKAQSFKSVCFSGVCWYDRDLICWHFIFSGRSTDLTNSHFDLLTIISWIAPYHVFRTRSVENLILLIAVAH